MKQIALDIGLASAPTLASFFTGPNEAVCKHLQMWVGNATRSPVPTYLWGEPGSGKTHLLKAVREALREQGGMPGWLDASMQEPPEFQESWSAILLDDVHLYTAVQQHAAFNWFVNAQTHQRWVLAAGSLPPADRRLREDLRSRRGWGHVFGLQVMDFMLTRFSRDLGSLMQLLDQLDGFALASKRAITVPLIKTMLESD